MALRPDLSTDALRYLAELLGLNLNPLLARAIAGGLDPSSTLGPEAAGINIAGSAILGPTFDAGTDWLFGSPSPETQIPFLDQLQGVTMAGPQTPFSPREREINPGFRDLSSPDLVGTGLGLYGLATGAQDIANPNLPAPYRAVQGLQTGLQAIPIARNIPGAVTALGDLFRSAPSLSQVGTAIGNAPSALASSLATALPSLATAGLSMGAGIGGTKAAEAAFGRSREQSMGSGAGAGVGALAGTILAPGIGTILGALIGAFGGGGIGSAFHNVPTTGTRFRMGFEQIAKAAGIGGIDRQKYTITEEQLAALSDRAKYSAVALGAWLGSYAPKFENNPTGYASQAVALLLNQFGEGSADAAKSVFEKYGMTSPYQVFADIMNRSPGFLSDAARAEDLWRSTAALFGVDPGATFDPQAIIARAEAEGAASQAQLRAQGQAEGMAAQQNLIRTGSFAPLTNSGDTVLARLISAR